MRKRNGKYVLNGIGVYNSSSDKYWAIEQIKTCDISNENTQKHHQHVCKYYSMFCRGKLLRFNINIEFSLRSTISPACSCLDKKKALAKLGLAFALDLYKTFIVTRSSTVLLHLYEYNSFFLIYKRLTHKTVKRNCLCRKY